MLFIFNQSDASPQSSKIWSKRHIHLNAAKVLGLIQRVEHPSLQGGIEHGIPLRWEMGNFIVSLILRYLTIFINIHKLKRSDSSWKYVGGRGER